MSLRHYVFLAAFCIEFAYTLYNVTVDDQNFTSILYFPQGSWTKSADNGLDFGGAHMLTENPNSTASFNFTGVAIYLLSPRWPYRVNTAVSLDSAPAVLVDLVDHSTPDLGSGSETVQSGVVWQANSLENKQHNLLISVFPGEHFGILDALMYTVLDSTNSTAPTSSISSISSSATIGPLSSSTEMTNGPSIAPPNTTSVPSSSSHKVVPIVVGTVIGVLGLLIFSCVLWSFCRRHRERPISQSWTVAGHTNPSSPQMGTYGHSLADNASLPPLSAQTHYYNDQSHQTTWNQNLAYPAMATAYTSNLQYGQPEGYYSSQLPPSQMGPQRDMRPQHPSTRGSNRYTNEPNSLSTITETSTPPFAEGHVPLAGSPSPPQSELGYQGINHAGEASERVSSVGSENRFEAIRSSGSIGPISVSSGHDRKTGRYSPFSKHRLGAPRS